MELWENEVYRFKTIGQLKVRLNACNSCFCKYECNVGCEKALKSHFILGKISCVHYQCVFLQAISQYLPRGDLRLRPAIYEMILHEFLKTDYEVVCLSIVFIIFEEHRVAEITYIFFLSLSKGFCHTDPRVAWRALQQHGHCSGRQRSPEEGSHQQHAAHHTG